MKKITPKFKPSLATIAESEPIWLASWNGCLTHLQAIFSYLADQKCPPRLQSEEGTERLPSPERGSDILAGPSSHKVDFLKPDFLLKSKDLYFRRKGEDFWANDNFPQIIGGKLSTISKEDAKTLLEDAVPPALSKGKKIIGLSSEISDAASKREAGSYGSASASVQFPPTDVFGVESYPSFIVHGDGVGTLMIPGEVAKRAGNLLDLAKRQCTVRLMLQGPMYRVSPESHEQYLQRKGLHSGAEPASISPSRRSADKQASGSATAHIPSSDRSYR